MSRQVAVAFVSGLIFACGLTLSGMTRPENIIAFLDLRHWNPGLLLVMISAMAVYATAFRLIVRRPAPLLSAKFEIPTARRITWQLVAGALMFGVGWGIAGFCGGPAIAAVATGRWDAVLFVATMFLGMFIHGKVFKN